MEFLLDTHTFLWFLEGSILPDYIEQKVAARSNHIYVSIASLWEIAIKINLGKLKITGGFRALQSAIINYNFEVLPVKTEHLDVLLELPNIHRDPFDRIIIAQAITENVTIITKDKVFTSYPVKAIW